MIANVSNLAFSLLTRTSTTRLQTELLRAQEELSSGRLQDEGLALGAKSISSIVLRSQIVDADSFLEANKVASTRFSALDTLLGSLADAGQSMQQSLVGAQSSSASAASLAQAARGMLDQVVSIANTTSAGAYVLAGADARKTPLNAFATVSGGPASAISDAFQAKFGREPGASENSAISPTDMQSFIDTEFASLFDSANWSTIWANASDETGEVRTSETTSVVNPASVSSPAIRDLVRSLVMVSGLGLQTLNPQTRQVVIEKASTALGSALHELADLSGDVGIKRNEIQDASDRLQARQVQLKSSLDEIVSVDPAEIATRLSSLSTQLQASYQASTRLVKLSLVNFL